MTCVPYIVPYNLPPRISSGRVRARRLKNIGAIIGGVLGFILLVAIVAAGVIISGGAGAAATAAFVPATAQVNQYGVFILASGSTFVL